MTERDQRRSRDDDRSSSRRSASRDDPERGSRSRDEGRDDDRRGASRGRDRDDDRGSRRGSSGSSKSFEYQGRSSEDVRERANKGANDFDKILKDGVKMFKPNDGDNRIRILPPTWKGAKHFGHDIYVHYGVGADRGSYLCLHKMKGEPDPINEERERARADDDEKYAKELDAKRRVLVYLIDRDHPKEGVQAWAMPWTVDRDIVKVTQDKETREVLPIDHPEDGYDVEFEKQGSKERTEYLAVSIARRSSKLGDSAWLDFAMDNPLPEQLNYYDYEHIAKAFKGSSTHKDSRSDERGSRDRDDDRGSRGGRDDDPRESSSSRDRDQPTDALTFESIHKMTSSELEDLVEQEKLDIDPSEAKDDDDLADWICEEMKLKKEETATRRRVTESNETATSDRLRRMRDERG